MRAVAPFGDGEVSHAAPPVSFGEAIRRGVTDWRFGVRGSRSEYWWLAVFSSLVTMAIRAALGPHDKGPVAIVVAVFLSVIMFKAFVRRYHDIGRSMWWAVLNYAVGYVATILAIIGFVAVVVSALGPGLSTRTHRFIDFGEAGLVVAVINGVWTLIWLCRAGEKGHNRWG